jgi:hypothetical protein
MHKVLDVLFGCPHHHTSFPLTPKSASGAIRRTYITCLDCGQEFDYDWSQMRAEEKKSIVEDKKAQPVTVARVVIKLPGLLRAGHRLTDKV